MSNIAIIPARGGSKRIKNKNIKIFNHKPIIQHTIEILKKTNLFDLIVVSSDSKKIEKLCQKIGIDFFIKRQKKLSGNIVSTHPVILNSIEILLKKKIKLKNIFCIYPTSVFINKNIINQALKKLKLSNAYVFSAIKYNHPIERSFKKINNKIIFNFQKKILSRTQDIKTSYHDAAQFYLANYKTWQRKKNILKSAKTFVEMPKFSCIDIDDLDDWYQAEKMFKIKKK